MIVDEEYRLPRMPDPLLDLDLTSAGAWVGVVGDTGQQTLRFGSQVVRLPELCHSPRVRAIGEEAALVIDAGVRDPTANAWVLTRAGQVVARFGVGEGIQDILVVPGGFVVTYLNEGIYRGMGPEHEGLVLFDHTGRLQWGYRSHFGTSAVAIDDCYCACLTEDGRLAFLPYVDFPLVCVDLQRGQQDIWSTPSALHGSSALTMRGDVCYFHAPYESWRTIWRWRLGDSLPTAVGGYTARLRGLSGGRFLALGAVGYTVITIVEAAGTI